MVVGIGLRSVGAPVPGLTTSDWFELAKLVVVCPGLLHLVPAVPVSCFFLYRVSLS